MSDWTVLCTRRASGGAITHLGVDVPRGTQHVPVAEAQAAMRAGRHRFFVPRDGDLLLLRDDPTSPIGLGTSADGPAGALLETLPDCGTAARFDG